MSNARKLTVSAAVEAQLKKLSARSRHVSLFLGAGTSRACGLPDMQELLKLVRADIGETNATIEYAFAGASNLEEALSRLRRVAVVLDDGAKLQGIQREAVTALDTAICGSITKHLSAAGTAAPYQRLAAWLNGQQYLKPIEVFTTNYDLLLDRALENERVHWFDGFVGAIEARFRSDLVDILSDHERALPPSCVRVWKLHGSLNWKFIDVGGKKEIVRTGLASGEAAAIFPSEDKYEESRRTPFLVLHDRLRRALQTPESLTMVAGYSFGDQHLNETLYDAARLYPRSELWVTCFGEAPEALRKQAALYPNIVVHSSSIAIVGGIEQEWDKVEGDALMKDGACQLGDFATLTGVLLPQNASPDGNI